MHALKPVSNVESPSIQSQEASCSPEDQWENWMDWDPSGNHVPGQQSVNRPLTGRDELHQQATVESQTQSTNQECSGFVALCKKRKTSEDSNSPRSIGKDNAKSTSVQNKNHSLVEKRYRTNLNDKIAELRQRVPSLRDDGQESGNDRALAPALKHNKATILTKAIDYIQQLEKRIAFLEDANNVLRRHNCDTTLTSREDKASSLEEDASKSPSSVVSSSPAASQAPTAAPGEPCGMMPVPENIRRLRESVPPQPHYADSYIAEGDAESTSSSRVSIRGGKLVGRLMLGSLAGMMIMDGFSESRKKPDSDRGLYALPLPSFLPHLRMLWTLQAKLATLPYGYLLIPLTRGFLVFAILGIILFLYLFNSKPRLGKLRAVSREGNQNHSTCPMEMRRNAWLTAIQTVWVPRHTMLPELWALILETHAYLTRQALGWHSYSWLTGRTEDDEIARVRAWEIAIDAQLVGGDSEMSRSRLVLTLWASGTLPATASRLMLKALHIRITFWQASRSQWITKAINNAGRYLARSQWRFAQEIINNPRISKSPGSSDPLPDHLVSLLQQPIEEIMSDRAVRHAHNLAWNQESVDGSGEGDAEIRNEDTAMLGSLDALAVWISNDKLYDLLIAFVDLGMTSASCHTQLELALRVAPPGSLSYIRVLAATAALYEADRETNIARVMEECPTSASLGITNSISGDVYEDIRVVIDCARALDTLFSSKDSLGALGTALEMLDRVLPGSRNMEVLTFTAVYQLMKGISEHPDLNGTAASGLNQQISETVAQMADPVPQETSNSRQLRGKYKAALQTLNVPRVAKRRVSNASVDTGYGSMNGGDHSSVDIIAIQAP